MRRQARLATYFSVVAVFLLGLQILRASQLEIEDAVFLTKNSIKQIHTQYLCKSRRIGCSSRLPQRELPEEHEMLVQPQRHHMLMGSDLDLDFPFSNVINSVFPIDLVISYNMSNTTHELTARYASFSPVLTSKLHGHYAIVEGHGCTPVNSTSHPQYKDKILIVLRGKCTFVRKVRTLVESDLKPRAVVVANNEPYRNLITMYSSTFNEDGLLTMPVLFISNEDYKRLDAVELANVRLSVETASIDSWINIMLLMAVSPPLLIVLFYLVMRGIQLCHRRHTSTVNQRMVRKMAVYIFNTNHLIPAPVFYEYLTLTHQTGDIPLVVSSSEDLRQGQDPGSDSDRSEARAPTTSSVVNGTDLYLLTNLHLLHAPRDYYPTLKCSICLDRFVPLRSRVLVLECRHIYHEACLLNWLINFRRTCPLCNELLSQLEPLRLLDAEHHSYGTFGPDLERGLPANSDPDSQPLHPHSLSTRISTVAVRSLHLEGGRSNSDSDSDSDSDLPSVSDADSSLGTSARARPGTIPGHGSRTYSQKPTLQWLGQDMANNRGFGGAGRTDGGAGPNGTPTFHSAGESIDSSASFVTSHTHLYSDAASSHYITPQNSEDPQGVDDSEHSIGSEDTIGPPL